MLFLSSCITPFLYAKARMPSIPELKESGGGFRKGEVRLPADEFISTLAKEGRRIPGAGDRRSEVLQRSWKRRLGI